MYGRVIKTGTQYRTVTQTRAHGGLMGSKITVRRLCEASETHATDRFIIKKKEYHFFYW